MPRVCGQRQSLAYHFVAFPRPGPGLAFSATQLSTNVINLVLVGTGVRLGEVKFSYTIEARLLISI